MKAPVCRLLYILIAAAISPTLLASTKTSTVPQNKPVILAPQQIADLLGWVPSKNKDNVCGGYYKQPTSITKTTNNISPDKSTTSITAEGPALFTASGRSILQKNVIVTQPGRIVHADKAFIYRNHDSGKITAIELTGHVRLQQKGKLITSEHAYLDLNKGSSVLDNGIYHFFFKDKQSNQHTSSAWGQAYKIKRRASGVIDLYQHASYTTCPPINPSWQIQAKRMHLDPAKKVGKAYNVVVKFKGVPILFTPYFSFSLNKKRKSGILPPTIGYNNKNGVDFALPIYWNMAPNYDMVITPRYLSKRGYQANAAFRFLTKTTTGRYLFNFLPGDKAYQQFKQTALNSYPNTAENQPYLNALQNSTNNRWMIGINQHSVFSDGWQSDFNINQVSDSYYLTDFNITANGATANQLLNQADLIYTGQHWDFTALFQGYQTLHPINQPVTNDQYRRLPEVDSNALYPDLGGFADFQWASSLVNFGYSSDFTPNMPTGQRAHFRPGITIPFTAAAGYVTPSLYLDNTEYSVSNPSPTQQHETSRTLPIFNINSGLYIDRHLKLGQHRFTSTFEPKLFYLLVPYTNQNDIPNFDTYRLPFSYSEVFSLNRFTGVDRIDNANQVSLGITSRLLNEGDGTERFKFDFGTIYYFIKPQVCLNSDCSPNSNHLSPLVSDVTFYPWSHWSTTASWAWDPNAHQTNNTAVTLNYIKDSSHLFTFQYNYVNDPDTTKYSNLAAGTYLPLSSHWNAIAYAYYNLTENRPDSYYFGLEYDTCCWNLRFISDREFQSTSPPPSIHNQYSTGYYVQLNLKGLGELSNHSADSLLLRTLPGYNRGLH